MLSWLTYVVPVTILFIKMQETLTADWADGLVPLATGSCGNMQSRVIIVMIEWLNNLLFMALWQCSGLSWKSCRSWSEFWEIQTSIYKEMCKKFLVLTKSCRSRTDGRALVSNTALEHTVWKFCLWITSVWNSVKKVVGPHALNFKS